MKHDFDLTSPSPQMDSHHRLVEASNGDWWIIRPGPTAFGYNFGPAVKADPDNRLVKISATDLDRSYPYQYLFGSDGWYVTSLDRLPDELRTAV